MTEPQRLAIEHDNADGQVRIIFAPGAGAGMHSDFMQFFACAFAQQGYEVVRFNFPYWQQFVETGVRRPPNRMPELEQCLRTIVQQFNDDKPCYLVGKSMGARVAFRLASEVGAQGAIALGFPFHPANKTDKLRLDDLLNHCQNNLIVQGSRDKMGLPAEVASYTIPNNIELNWIDGGDHSFEPTKRSGLERAQLWQSAIECCVAFIQSHQQNNA